MGSDVNRLRKKWQDYSGKNAAAAERSFFKTFQIIFEGTEFEIRADRRNLVKFMLTSHLMTKRYWKSIIHPIQLQGMVYFLTMQ